MYVRDLDEGLGRGVAERTYLRQQTDGSWETWGDLANRVADGNTSLVTGAEQEKETLAALIAKGLFIPGGRHLQHGDSNQKNRPMEVYTNCATACTSFMLFELLLNGSGVGRSYDDALMLTDWRNSPDFLNVLSPLHPDYQKGLLTPLDVSVLIQSGIAQLHTVEDSREGWARVVEALETRANSGRSKDTFIVFDWSEVRAKGAPIGGMQGRPSSGPIPAMEAIDAIRDIRGSDHPRWLQAMLIDHALASCVVVGGARRAARIATKWYQDEDILEFVKIKNTMNLWSANNSVAVTQEFFDLARVPYTHEQTVFHAVSASSYGSGEPGYVLVDRLTQKDEGIEELLKSDSFGCKRFRLTDRGMTMHRDWVTRALELPYHHIVNPCGEISLFLGYCVIGSVAPFHGDDDNEIEEACRAAARFLIRVNTMDSNYKGEVRRTNRIGVGLTGIHEYAWDRFGFSFRDLLNEDKSIRFWQSIYRFSDAVIDESISYSALLGLNTPHTALTAKPDGSISKLYALTEGIHLPARKFYLRWVQFRNSDPLLVTYKELGYPTRELTDPQDTTIVGFPTTLTLAKLGMGDALVTAPEATPEEQFQWLRLLEKYWLQVNHPGRFDNQLSYTLKYNPDVVSYEEYYNTMLDNMATVKGVSVQPYISADKLAGVYEYTPEEDISAEDFFALENKIAAAKSAQNAYTSTRISDEELYCSNGACPL